MPEALSTELLTPEQAAQQAVFTETKHGLRYATLGALFGAGTPAGEVQRLTGAVPAGIAETLRGFQYIFVPLALSAGRLQGEEDASFPLADRTFIAAEYHASLLDKAICHRNATVEGKETVFLSSRLHTDRFALAFEFFINVAHNYTDTAGAPESFCALLWQQVEANVRGETSIDAWEDRAAALGVTVAELDARSRAAAPRGTGDEKAKADYFAAAFSDALAIYLLSLHLDVNYADLREREYPLLAPAALAERLKAVNRLFPSNDGYSFQILYRRRG